MQRLTSLMLPAFLAVLVVSTASTVSDAAPITVGGKTYPSLGQYQQTEEFLKSGARCATATPSYETILAALKAPSDCSAAQSANLDDYADTTVYTIPVWVHIITNDAGTLGNVSDALIQAQIDVLNEDFRALAGTPGQNGADVMVQFCLAATDRTASSEYFDACLFRNCDPNDVPFANEQFKTALNQDPSNYLNIYTKWWPDFPGLLGYATFPWEDAGQPRDGVVINWQNFGRNSPAGPPYNQGRTTTHEVGHYLGLFHTFQHWCSAGLVGEGCSLDLHCDTSTGAGDGLCPVCTSETAPGCYTDDDRICDTNPQLAPTSGCVQNNSCSSADPIENYMDYSVDTCMEEFSPEQSGRIRCAIENYRADLPGDCGSARCDRVTVIDFDNPPVPRFISGEFGGIDWGSGQWAGWNGPVGGCPPAMAYMTCTPEGCSVDKCRDFTFVEPSIFQSFNASTWAAGGDLYLASLDENGNVLEELSTFIPRGQCTIVETGFTVASAGVRVCYSLGSDLGVDDLTYCTPTHTQPDCPCGEPCRTRDGLQGVCAGLDGLPICGEHQCECFPVCLPHVDCPCGEACVTPAGEQGVCTSAGTHGVCECTANPDPECAPATCETFVSCDNPGGCLEPVCGSTAEGGGLCVEGATPCSSLTDCTTSADCTPGFCFVDSCCLRPVCVPPSQFCSLSNNGAKAATAIDGPTFGSP